MIFWWRALRSDPNYDWNFTPLLISLPNDRRFKKELAVGEHVLQFCRIDIFSSRNHDVLLAIIDVDPTVLVGMSDVTGMKPTIGNRFGGGFRIRPVLLEDVRPANPQLAGIVCMGIDAAVVDDPNFALRRRFSARAGMVSCLIRL